MFDSEHSVISTDNKQECSEKKASKNSLKSKKLKIILFSISGIISVAIFIIILIATKRKGKNKTNNNPKIPTDDPFEKPEENKPYNQEEKEYNNQDENQNDNQEETQTNKTDDGIVVDQTNKTDDGIVVDINHKKSEVSIYDDSTNKTTNLEFNDNGIPSRRLSQKSIVNEINGKYLLNIYNIDDSSNIKIYDAYAILLSLTKKIKDKEIKIIGIDLINLNDEDFPFIKFKFNSKGTILNLEVDENYNLTLINHIYEFIEKVVPQLEKEFYGRKLQEKSYSFIKENDNNGKIIINDSKDYNQIDGSQNERNMEIIIKDNTINKVLTQRHSKLIQTNYFNINDDNIFLSDTEGNNFATRDPFIKSLTEKLDSSLTISSSEINETLGNEINKIIESKNLINYNNNESKLRLLNNNKLRKNDDIISEPFRQPFVFTYPLFNIDFLGVKIGLFSKVAFLPITGDYRIEFFFNKNGQLESITSKHIETNFDSIINSIDDIIDRLRVLIENSVALEIKEIYNEKEKILDQQLNNLFKGISIAPDLSDIFQDPLKELFNTIKSASVNCYNDAIDNAELVEKNFNDLSTSINNGEQINIKNIIDISKNDIDEFINDHQNDANSIYEAAQIFYPGIRNSIEKRLAVLKQNDSLDDFNFDITSFYDIKDIYNQVINIMNNFKIRIENAIYIENLTFYNEINKQFDDILNEPLKNVEIISYNAKNNASVIDAMRSHWNNQIGDQKRELLINRINILRTNITNMISYIFEHIKNTYNEKIFESESYNLIINNLKLISEEITVNQTSLLDYLRTFVHFDQNFSIYIDDVKALLSVNYKASNIREESYKKYIINELNKIEDTYTTDEFLTQIYDRINQILAKIIYATQKRQYGEALENCTVLKQEVNNIITNSLSNYVLTEITNIYSNHELLKKMIDNYYSKVIPAYEEFNNTFFNKYFLVHVGEYVSKPTEIITKFNKIILSQEEEKKSQIDNINDLIILSINNAIENSYNKVYQKIKIVKNEFYSRAPKNKYGEMGTYRGKYEEIEDKLDEILGVFFDLNGNMKIINKYVKKKQDEFSLSEKGIEEYEKEITNNLKKISDEIDYYFDDYYCKGNNLCENGKFKEILVSSFDQFNYQLAKLRDSVSHLKNLIPTAEKMTEETLMSLNSNKFLDLYSKYNYYSFDIAADFKNYLFEIKEETDIQMQPFIDEIKNDIIQTFKNQLNIKGINESIEIIALKVFSSPNSLKNELKSYLKMICGPKLKIMDLFTKEIEYYSFKGYSLDLVSYETNYKELKEEIEQFYKTFSDTLFNKLILEESLKNQLKEAYRNITDDAYNNLKDKINILSIFQNFQFLDHEYDFNNVVNDALNEVSNNLKIEMISSVDSLYQKYLLNFQSIIKKEIEEIYKENLNYLDSQYNSTLIEFQTFNGKNGKITEISVYDNLKDVFNNFFSKVKEIYNDKDLNDIFKSNQKNEINNLGIQVKFNDFIENLNEDINTFQDEARKRLIDEKLEFSSNIESSFVKGFNKTISDYMKGNVISEMNKIFEEDYSSNIKNKFRYLQEEINSIKDYMIVLLESPDLKSVSKRLSDTLKTIYRSINEEFNEIIPLQINNTIYKRITIFEDEILDLIPNKFINKLLIELKSSDFKARINNEKILDLIPQSFPEGFKSNLTSYFKEYLNKLALASFKENYEKNINSDLKEISRLLSNYNSLIREKVSYKSQSQTSSDMIGVINEYNKYLNVVNNYNNIFIFELNPNKVNEIKTLFTDYLLKEIISIREGFDYQIQIGEKQVEIALSNYDYFNASKIVEEELLKTNISEVVSNAKSQLNETMNLLNWAVGNKFDEEMRDKLPKECENITRIEFKKSDNPKRRNLKDYNIYEINDYIKLIEKQYKEFNHSVLTNENFIGIRTKEESFISKLVDATNRMDDYFYRYEYLIKEYTKLGTFTEKYKNQSLKVQKYIQEFLTQQVSKIDNTVNTIQTNVKYGWDNLKSVINQSIKDALDKEFNRLFYNLEPLNSNDLDLDIQKKISEPIEVYDNYQQLLFSVNLETIASNLKYSYYMKGIKNENMYNFDIDIHTSGSLNVSINTEINGLYKGELKGVLGSGIIGIKPYYYLEDKSVEVNAYVKSQPSSYTYLFEEFDFDDWKFVVDDEKNINIEDIQELNFIKIFRIRN